MSGKDTRKTCHIYSKLSIKTPEQNLVLLLLLTLIYFAFYSTAMIAEQTNAVWA